MMSERVGFRGAGHATTNLIKIARARIHAHHRFIARPIPPMNNAGSCLLLICIHDSVTSFVVQRELSNYHAHTSCAQLRGELIVLPKRSCALECVQQLFCLFLRFFLFSPCYVARPRKEKYCELPKCGLRGELFSLASTRCKANRFMLDYIYFYK